MSKDSIRRSLPVFPMSVVVKLTELTPRQIRYYEEHELVVPERTEGNQRLFSMNNLDKLLEIKRLLEKGFNIKAIKQILIEKNQGLTNEEKLVRERLYTDVIPSPNRTDVPLNRGDLSRFYK